jgi:hypothetical protein
MRKSHLPLLFEGCHSFTSSIHSLGPLPTTSSRPAIVNPSTMRPPDGALVLQSLSDEELVYIFSYLGTAYACVAGADPRASAGPNSDLQALASVCSRFRRLVHTRVAKTVIMNDCSSFLLLEDCPQMAQRVLGSAELLFASRASELLQVRPRFQKTFREFASSLTSVSILGGTLTRTELQLLTQIPRCARLSV